MQAQGLQMMREAMQELQQAIRKRAGQNSGQEPDQAAQGDSAPGPGAMPPCSARTSPRGSSSPRISTPRSRQVLNEANRPGASSCEQNFQFMRSLMPNQPAGGNPPAAGAQPDPNAAPPPPRSPGTGQAGQGQARADWRSRRPRRRGGGGANGQNNTGWLQSAKPCRKSWSSPRSKPRWKRLARQQSQLRDREYAMVFKAMDRRQVAVFKKMLGKPFDVDSIMNGVLPRWSGRPWWPRRAAKRGERQRATTHRGRGQCRYRQDNSPQPAPIPVRTRHNRQAGHDSPTAKPARTARPGRPAAHARWRIAPMIAVLSCDAADL